jgi:Ni,Fe-hydrogenase III small subunit
MATKWRSPSEYVLESEIQADILLAFGAVPYMRIWRQNVGKAYPVSMRERIRSGESCRPVMFGSVGQADIMGIIAPHGRGIAIEVKMPGEHLRPEQVTWRDMWVAKGGLHIIANCVEDVAVCLRAAGVPVP